MFSMEPLPNHLRGKPCECGQCREKKKEQRLEKIAASQEEIIKLLLSLKMERG